MREKVLAVVVFGDGAYVRRHPPGILALAPVGANDDALKGRALELGDPVGLDLDPVARPLARQILAVRVLDDQALAAS